MDRVGGGSIYHNHGDADGLVPMDENSSIVQTRYTALGGSMTLEVLAGQGHSYNPAFFESQAMADFIVHNAIIGAGPDETAPGVTALNPAAGATGAPLGGRLTITFNEFVQKGAAGNITTFHQQVTGGVFANDTVRRSIDGCLDCILGREAAARGTELTMDQLLKENRKLEVDLTGLKA